jgi:pyruvate dehydrogenase E2 component (dihydrolipoamide acetyltransferase)
MELGSIVSWEKKEGEFVEEGDVLAQVETDKATMEMESPVSGYIAKILVPAGTRDIPLGKDLCVVTENEQDIGLFKDFTAEETSTTAPADTAGTTPTPAGSSHAPPTPSAPPNGKQLCTLC